MTTEQGVELRVPQGFLHSGQQAIHDHPARFRVIAAGRRYGKTTLAVWECIEVAAQGGVAWWVAPTYRDAGIGWRMLMFFASQIPDTEVNKSDRRIMFPGGGWVEARSTHLEGSLRGEGLDFVVLDEAAQMPQQAWTQEIRPALGDREGRAMFISTPLGLNNWFHSLFEKADGADSDWHAWQLPSWTSPIVSDAEIEALRKDLATWEFDQEIGAQFIEHRIGGIMWERHFRNRYELVVGEGGDTYYNLGLSGLVAQDSCMRVAAVDLAYSVKETADHTAIVIGDITPDREKLIIVHVRRERIEFAQQVPTLLKMNEKWEPLGWAIEQAASQGLPTIQEARRAGLTVLDTKPKGQDKVRRAAKLVSVAEDDNLWLPASAPWVADFKRECIAFTGAAGGEDDQVDAAAYLALSMQLPLMRGSATSTITADTRLPKVGL